MTTSYLSLNPTEHTEDKQNKVEMDPSCFIYFIILSNPYFYLARINSRHPGCKHTGGLHLTTSSFHARQMFPPVNSPRVGPSELTPEHFQKAETENV